jgi:hypothetical protein
MKRLLPMQALRRFDILPGVPGNGSVKHRRHCSAPHLVGDREPVGKPLILVPIEVADQRPKAFRRSRILKPRPCPAVSGRFSSAERGAKPSASSLLEPGQHRVDLRQLAAERILFVVAGGPTQRRRSLLKVPVPRSLRSGPLRGRGAPQGFGRDRDVHVGVVQDEVDMHEVSRSVQIWRCRCCVRSFSVEQMHQCCRLHN